MLLHFRTVEGDACDGEGEDGDGRSGEGPLQGVVVLGVPGQRVARAKDFPEVTAGDGRDQLGSFRGGRGASLSKVVIQDRKGFGLIVKSNAKVLLHVTDTRLRAVRDLIWRGGVILDSWRDRI
jgi:hypothetical protein